MAQAALIADATGYMLKHPFIQHHLQRVLMKWAYRRCTSGGFRLPGFALADDGYLFLHEGQVICGSDWIPKTSAIAESSCRRGLVVRYPIRMKEDLLPVENLSAEDTVRQLAEHLKQRGCQLSREGVAAVAGSNCKLRGTLVLHSETAARNGGDYDFDMVCLVEDNRFPRFVEDRFAYEEQHSAVKTKNPKPPSPWWNLPQVSMQARGNQIGAITDLKTSCLAKGRPDLARELVDQLQNALDQLKHGTQPDQEVIRNIRNDVPTAPWLKLKQKRRIEDMDEHIEVDANDKVGEKAVQLHAQGTGAVLRQCRHGALERFPGSDRRTELYPGNLSGVLRGQPVLRQPSDRDLDWVGANRSWRIWKKPMRTSRRTSTTPRLASNFSSSATKASAVLNAYEKRAGEELKALVNGLQKWSSSKNGTRLSYLSALHAIVCRERRITPDPNAVTGTGSIVFYSFPQEVVNQIAERTGGRPVTVEIPSLCDGEVEIDSEGRIFRFNPSLSPTDRSSNG